MMPRSRATLPRFEDEVDEALRRNTQATFVRGLRLWAITLAVAFVAGLLIGIKL